MKDTFLQKSYIIFLIYNFVKFSYYTLLHLGSNSSRKPHSPSLFLCSIILLSTMFLTLSCMYSFVEHPIKDKIKLEYQGKIGKIFLKSY